MTVGALVASGRYRPVMPRTAAALVLLIVLALGACSADPTDGTGHLQVADLENPAQVGHFTGDPEPLTARVEVTSTGCVHVVVDEVERFPFWPTGTTVEQLVAETDQYAVTLPDGTTLTTGESFEGSGVVDDSAAPFVEGSLAAMLLDFCAVEGAPVAFFDASTIVPSDS